MYALLRMAASGWIGIKKKMTRSQELQNSRTFQLKLTVPEIFQLIPQINIDIIIVGLHLQRKQCDVNNIVHISPPNVALWLVLICIIAATDRL